VIEPHYTVKQLAEWVGLNPETIRREAAKGNLNALRFGKDLRFPESAVMEWLESKRSAV
jgi:excisionase family DNA binding protein